MNKYIEIKKKKKTTQKNKQNKQKNTNEKNPVPQENNFGLKLAGGMEEEIRFCVAVDSGWQKAWESLGKSQGMRHQMKLRALWDGRSCWQNETSFFVL